MKLAVQLLLCLLLIYPCATSGRDLSVAQPGDAGMSSGRLARIGGMLEGYVRRGEIAGSVALVVRRGRTVYLDCRGVRDLESGATMTDDSIFRIYSMTKPVASVALMMLYEEGFFQLDDPVESYIPEFAAIKVFQPRGDSYRLVDPERGITVKQLLTHTGALNYSYPEGSDLQRRYDELNKAKVGMTLREWVGRLAEFPIAHQPDTRWQYSTPSTDVVGCLVEVLSGKSLDSFLRDRIFDPLGMKDTGFHVPGDKIGRFTALYGPPRNGSGKISLIDDPRAGRYSAGPPVFFSGGGGLVSTATDYARFAGMMLNGGELDGVRILGRKTVELITANHLRPEMIPFGFDDPRLDYVTRGWGFGLGYAVLLDPPLHGLPGSVGTYKWAGAANTDCWIDPREQLIGLLMTQFMPNGYYPIDKQFRTLVYQALTD